MDDADKAAKAAYVWNEIKSMARDYARAAEIRVNMHVADHAIMHVGKMIDELGMDGSAQALSQAWTLVLQIVGPIIEMEEIDGDDEGTVRGHGPSTEEPAGGGEPAPAPGERASHDGAGATVRRLGDRPTGAKPSER